MRVTYIFACRFKCSTLIRMKYVRVKPDCLDNYKWMNVICKQFFRAADYHVKLGSIIKRVERTANDYVPPS